MVKPASEVFNDKVSLIYEYNKKSPLFVRKAGIELENHNVERAIEILNTGLRYYPNYAAAHILLGKALALSGNYDEAKSHIKTGSALIQSDRIHDHYMKEIDSSKNQKSLFDVHSRPSFLTDDQQEPEKQTELFKEPPKESDHPFSDIENRLEEIAREISSVKLSDLNEMLEYEIKPDKSFNKNDMIVSETLAKIYAAQGELMEAIDVYTKLIKKDPSKEDYYSAKIEELRLQLE